MSVPCIPHPPPPCHPAATAGSALLNGAGMLVMGFAPKDTWLAFALGRVLCGLGVQGFGSVCRYWCAWAAFDFAGVRVFEIHKTRYIK